MTSPERWEIKQLIASGAASAADYPGLDEDSRRGALGRPARFLQKFLLGLDPQVRREVGSGFLVSPTITGPRPCGG
jgi:hypothetical protein